MDLIDTGMPSYNRDNGDSGCAVLVDERATAAATQPRIVTVPISLLAPGDSPRLAGEDEAHIRRLAEVETPLPPILVDRRGMRVIDGMHRLMAAVLKGAKTIDVEFFDGSEADAYLRSVEANVTHGFPLSLADRRAAAARIITLHPHMSDRAVAKIVGLGAKTVAGIRSSTDGVPQLNARMGRDGKVRPLSSAEGRRKAARLMTERPEASLREVAKKAGISLATASDVRKRLVRGEEPVPAGVASDASDGEAARPAKSRTAPRPAEADPVVLLEKLLRDPSLRLSETGRRLLRLLRSNAFVAQNAPKLIAVVPQNRKALTEHLAEQYAQMWSEFARELDGRSGV